MQQNIRKNKAAARLHELSSRPGHVPIPRNRAAGYDMQQNISPIKAIRTGAQLREAREALGLTQGELARRCGLTGKHAWMTIQRNEKSKRIPVHTGLIVEALLQGAKLSTCAED